MTPDHELLLFTAFATVVFAAIALFFGRALRRIERARRSFKPPHRTLELIFRLWFAALALGALALTLFGHTGLFPGLFR